MDIQDIREIANTKISQRTELGERNEIALIPSHTLVWSNRSGSWSVGHSRIPKGTRVTLDANQVLVPGTTRQLRGLASSGQLDSLPLYSNSFETRYGESPKGSYQSWFDRTYGGDPEVRELEDLSREIRRGSS